jgi:ribose 5-phosphate isomerase A
MTSADKKRKAAEASLEFIEPGAILGVGTGSTVNVLIDLLPGIRNRIDRVVSSSKATTALLEERGFTVSTLNEVGDLDLYIDGADEATKRLNLIKGGGGALTREKVLAGAARRFVCIVDDSKLHARNVSASDRSAANGAGFRVAQVRQDAGEPGVAREFRDR